MSRKRHTPEQIIGKLREAEIVLSLGKTVPQACKQIGVTEQITTGGERNTEAFGWIRPID